MKVRRFSEKCVDSFTVKDYIDSLEEYNVTREEEIEYFKKIKSGDLEAEKEFINRNLRLVPLVSRLYSKKTSLDELDLIQTGNLGLISAVKRFKPELGNRFSTYAEYWIKSKILNYIADHNTTVRMPRYFYAINQKINEYKDKYVEENGIEPTIEEIAKALDMTNEQVEDVEKLKVKMISMGDVVKGNKTDPYDTDAYSTTSVKYEDLIEDKNIDIEKDLLEEDRDKILDDYLNSMLNEKELETIKLRYGFYGKNYTQTEIGEKFDLSHERIRQIEVKAINKLRSSKKASVLTDYVTEEEIKAAKDNIKVLKKKK